MKTSDIDHLHSAGLITAEQRAAIIEHYQLDHESNRLLVILAIIGAVLVSAGIILLIASNWEDIPRLVKLAGALVLLVGAHGAGWRLARDGRHPVIAQALHLVGSGMFLANIALVGQTYNLSSRPPNAILLWLAGVVPLAWILRSRAHHILSLCIFGLWLGLELNQHDSFLFFDGEARQFMVYALLGSLFIGLGQWLDRSRFPEFGPATEKFGLLALHLAAYPMALGPYYGSDKVAAGAWAIAGGITVAAAALALISAARWRVVVDTQWRWVWALAQLGLLALTWHGLTAERHGWWYETRHEFGPHWIAMPVLFLFCLIQAHVGLIRRSPWMINLAITFIGVYIITAYIELFGTMQQTGLMFLMGGALLIGLAIYLERKRRALLKRMTATPPSASN